MTPGFRNDRTGQLLAPIEVSTLVGLEGGLAAFGHSLAT